MPSDGDLNAQFPRGDILRATDLEAKKQAELNAKEVFKLAAGEEVRNQRFQIARPTAKDMTPTWKREPFEE